MSLKRQSILLSISNVIQVLTSLLFSVFIARLIVNKADFGSYQQVFVLINFLAVVASSIPNALSFFFGKYNGTENFTGIFKRFFVFLSISSLIAIIIFLVLNKWISSELHNTLMQDYALIVAGIAFMRLVIVYFSNFSLLTNKLAYYILVTGLYLIGTIALLVAIFILKLNILQILIGQFIIDAVRLVLMLPAILPFLKTRNNFLLKKEEIKYLYPLFGVAILSNLYLIIDRIMISSMLGPADFADYQVGAFVFPFIGIVTGSIITALLPRISQFYHSGEFKQITDNLKRATEKVTIILVPIFVYCTVFGRELIAWLYSDKYAFSGHIFQIYTIRFFGSVVLFSMMMNAIGLQVWVLTNTIVNLIINFVLNYFFIRNWGVMGAVYAGIASTYLGYILPVTVVNSKLKVSLLDYFPLKIYIRTLAMSFVIALFFKLVYKYYINLKIWSVILSFVYYIIMLAILDRELILSIRTFKSNLVKRNGA